MFKQLLRFARDEDAVTAAEYAVMLALIVIAIIAAVNSLGSTSSGIWANDTSKITTAIGS